jgi:large repetitive protein
VPANGASFTSGTAVTFSVSVTAASGGVQPTGTVQFKVDGANHGGVVTLSGTGTASTSVTGLTTASHTLSVTYSGDANYAAAAAISVSITVKAAAAVKLTEPLTTEELNSTSAIDLVGDVTSKLAPAPTGKVMFAVDGKCVATAAIVSGKASATAGKLAAGIHTVRAVYGGDAHHSAATASEEITVGP